MHCPLCGHEMDADRYQTKVADLHHAFQSRGVRLTKMEARFLAVLQGRNRPMPRAVIIDGLYGDRADGGPDWADGNLSVFACNIRKKIRSAKLPWALLSVEGFGYELQERKTAGTLKRAALALAIALPLGQVIASRIS